MLRVRKPVWGFVDEVLGWGVVSLVRNQLVRSWMEMGDSMLTQRQLARLLCKHDASSQPRVSSRLGRLG